MDEPRWIQCVDWQNLSKLYRKGDRVKLTGFFEDRRYEKEGELKEFRQYVVKSAELQKPRIRQEAA